jgi:hypothetical protein
MKGVGVSLVVYGHVAHASTVALTPPIYVKQLGVAFFLFATAFTLARERRSSIEVLFNRCFTVYLFGLSLAALISTVRALSGATPELSNYLPFLGGANVLFDNFPANPSTWYIGTYVHLLLVWALCLRQMTVRRWMIAAALLIEIPMRALLIATAGPYVAYMLLTNWGAVFLFGLAQGARPDGEPQRRTLHYAIALFGGLLAWSATMRWVPFDPTFPFMTLDSLSSMPGMPGALIASAAASTLYLSAAALMFGATRRIEAPGPVRFMARNSLIVFLAHMPVYFALHPILVSWGLSYWPRVAVQLLVCLVALAWLSEAIVAVVRPDRLRRAVFSLVTANVGVVNRVSVSVARAGDVR